MIHEGVFEDFWTVPSPILVSLQLREAYYPCTGDLVRLWRKTWSLWEVFSFYCTVDASSGKPSQAW